MEVYDDTLEDVLEACNMTPVEALEYLINAGLLELPPFMEDDDGLVDTLYEQTTTEN